MDKTKDYHYYRAVEDAREDARKGIHRTEAEVESEAARYRRAELVSKLASLAHDDWRAPRKVEGTDRYEPRIKKVKDQAWIDRHNGQTDVDIANTSYSELPSEWQAENKASAEIAMDEVLKAVEGNVSLDDSFVEQVADVLHQGWVKRNESWAAEELKKPYAELPETEKEKDRYFVRRAIQVYQQRLK